MSIVYYPGGEQPALTVDPDTDLYTRYDEQGQIMEQRPLTDDERDRYRAAQRHLRMVEASAELDRAIAQTAPEQLAAVNRLAHVDGEVWTQPLGAHDAYAKDATVAYDGAEWRSVIDANAWAPGVAGWDKVTPPGEVEDWSPRDSTNGYPRGKRVRFEGAVWMSLVDANVWSPRDYPGGWEKQGDA